MHVANFAMYIPNFGIKNSKGENRFMKRHYLLFLALLPLIGWAHEDTLRLSLDDCIMMARRQSIDAAVALGELRSAYWQWRSYRADLLPEVSLSGTAPSWNKRYSSYQQADGSLSFVRNDYLGLDGAVNITQKLWPTGGTLSIKSSLDYLHQSANASPSGGGREGTSSFIPHPSSKKGIYIIDGKKVVIGH